METECWKFVNKICLPLSTHEGSGPYHCLKLHEKIQNKANLKRMSKTAQSPRK